MDTPATSEQVRLEIPRRWGVVGGAVALACVPVGFVLAKHWLPIKWAPIASLFCAVVVRGLIDTLSKSFPRTANISAAGVEITSLLGRSVIEPAEIEEVLWEAGVIRLKHRGRWLRLWTRPSDAGLLDAAFIMLKQCVALGSAGGAR